MLAKLKKKMLASHGRARAHALGRYSVLAGKGTKYPDVCGVICTHDVTSPKLLTMDV